MMASTEVIIDAPIEIVWEIMTNVSKYPEWNPFVVFVEQQEQQQQQQPLRVGDYMTLHVVFPKDKEGKKKLTKSKERILVLDPPSSSKTDATNKSATWEYQFVSWLHYWYLVRATRIQQLTEIMVVVESSSNGGKNKTMTKYYTKETFGGCLVRWIPLKDVQEGFEAQAQALKAHAEQRQQEEAQQQ